MPATRAHTIYAQTRTHRHVDTRTIAHTHTQTRMETQTQTQTHVHRHIHTRTIARTHTNNRTRTHAKTHTDTHKHARIRPPSPNALGKASTRPLSAVICSNLTLLSDATEWSMCSLLGGLLRSICRNFIHLRPDSYILMHLLGAHFLFSQPREAALEAVRKSFLWNLLSPEEFLAFLSQDNQRRPAKWPSRGLPGNQPEPPTSSYRFQQRHALLLYFLLPCFFCNDAFPLPQNGRP